MNIDKFKRIEFKVWLARNNLTQKQLADMLGITENTICNYNNNNSYPKMFKFSLIGLEATLNKLD